jgi:hypothetical protein
VLADVDHESRTSWSLDAVGNPPTGSKYLMCTQNTKNKFEKEMLSICKWSYELINAHLCYEPSPALLFYTHHYSILVFQSPF